MLWLVYKIVNNIFASTRESKKKDALSVPRVACVQHLYAAIRKKMKQRDANAVNSSRVARKTSSRIRKRYEKQITNEL
jgi:hypothetical protein